MPSPPHALQGLIDKVTREVTEQVTRPGERLLTEMKARYEVDVAGMVAGLRARLEGRLSLTPLPIDADLAERHGRYNLGRVHTQAFEAPRIRKLVVSEVYLWPLVEGVALTIHPQRDLEAAPFGADLMVLPARLSANADIYGPPSLSRGPLAPLSSTFARFDEKDGPQRRTRYWAAIASGEGLHASVSPRLLADAFAAVNASVGAYLDAISTAPSREAPTPEPHDDAHSLFFRTFHEHGPRRGPLRYLFGAEWAERYSRLLFE